MRGLVEMAVRVDAPRQNQASVGIDGARATGKAVGESHDLAVTNADVTASAIARRYDCDAANHEIKQTHAINPSPRLAQNVMRCSIMANSAYMPIPITAMTKRPANTRGVSKLDVAAIIR